MTSSSLLKHLAAFVAVFGLAAVPAFAQEQPEQPTTPTEQQTTPEQPDGSGGTGGTGTDEGGDEDGTATQAGKPTQAETDQYNRYCNQKDAEPSHSDKKFCEEYERKYGKGGATAVGKPTQEEIDRYNRYCRMKDAEPSHSDKKFCEDFKRKYPDYGKGTTAGTNTTPTDNEENKKDEEPDSGPLAFTGLDIWQLALIGVVLVGGGLGARRLLAHQG